VIASVKSIIVQFTGERERSRDDGLARDNGRDRREHHQRKHRPVGRKAEERAPADGGIVEEQRDLPRIVKQQRRQHDGVPDCADRISPDMAHIGVQRLATGDRQEYGAQHREGPPTAAQQKTDGVIRVDRDQHARMARDAGDPEHRDGDEPEQHDRTEGLADDRGPAALDGEQPEQDRHRHRQHIGLEDLGADVEAFQRAQHRNGRRDDAVAIDQGGPEQSHRHEDAPAPRPSGADQRHQRQDSAFAVIVGPHHEDAVFDRDRDDQGPEDQRQAPERGVGAKRAAHGLGHRLQRVERAGPEVAIDDAERRQCGGRRGCR
jgi:hypothetical protein